MTTELAKPADPMNDFQEKIIKRLRDDIREMLPDEALEKLALRAVDDEFFKPRERFDSYSRVIDSRPSWFVEKVAEIARPIIQEKAAQFVEANQSLIEKSIYSFVSAENLSLLMCAAMSKATSQQIMEAADLIVARIKQNY